jgi:hypothetical protein
MGRNNKIMREMEGKVGKLSNKSRWWGWCSPKNGFFLGRKWGVGGFKGKSGVNVWVNSRKCDTGQENDLF